MKLKYYNPVSIVALMTVIMTMAFMSCEDFVVFEFPQAVASSDDAGASSLGELFASDKKSKPKLGNLKIRVSQGEYGNRIVVAWKAIQYADYYKVLRRKKPTDNTPVPFTLVKPAVLKGTTSYTDVFDIDSMQEDDLYASYQYKVEALTYKGSKSTSLYSEDAYLLLPPRALLKATKSLPTITVTWQDIRGASRYKLYRSEVKNSFGTLLPLTFAKGLRRFTDTEPSLEFGKNYYYYVVAISASGETSAIGEKRHPVVNGMRIEAKAPKPPQVQASKAASVSEITVSWNEVKPSKLTSTISYNVFRNSSKSSRIIELLTDSQNTTHLDADALEENVEYHYFVQAVEVFQNNEKLVGAYSADVDPALGENPQTGYILSSPTNVQATRSGNDVVITWTKSKKATGYEVHAASSMNGPYTKTGTLGDVATYRHEKQGASTAPIFYKVFAVQDLIVSKQAKPIAPLPDVPAHVQASKNAYDSYYARLSIGAIYPVKVTWNKAWGATRYTLWRAERKDGAYSKIADTTNTQAYDESSDMEVGTYYYYKVSAENSIKASSDRSTAVAGYGALTNKELVNQLNRTIGSSHAKLTLMHKWGPNALGEETKRGYVSGHVKYHGQGQGLGAKIVNVYTNYADKKDKLDATKPFLVINGSNTTTVTIDISLNPNGTQSLNYTIGGMYGFPNAANVKGNLRITSGSASGGTYTVKQNNGVPEGKVNNDDVHQP